MKKSRALIVWLPVVIVLLLIIVLTISSGGPRREAEATRQMLRQQGFKTELSDFNFSTNPEATRRADLFTPRAVNGLDFNLARLDLLAPVGTNSALVLWQLSELPSESRGDGWPMLRESLKNQSSFLDDAVRFAFAGPIKFNLEVRAGSFMPLQHLMGVRNIDQHLALRAVLELHDQNRDAAWTNLLAMTRFVTAWDPEPVEASHLVHLACADTAFKTAWQMLQAGGWDDDRLAALQREWEGVDFFKGLPETEAFSRASMVALCQAERRQPLRNSFPPSQLIHSPGYVWPMLTAAWEQFRYRHKGTYEDEKALLLFYRDREIEMRQAIQCSNWLAMRQLPAVTNVASLKSKSRQSARLQVMFNVRQISMAAAGRGGGPLVRAAESEARRRLLITAIALERFHGRHGAYPKTLAELSPELLPKPLPDFMDGQPLRYHPTDDGHFVLYSVGLDGNDDGGQFAPLPARRQAPYPNLSSPVPRLGLQQYPMGVGLNALSGASSGDLLWPRPASTSEIKARLAEEKHQEELRQAALQAEREAAEQAAEARRQDVVQELYAEAQAGKTANPAPEAALKGKPLAQLLRNEKVVGTNQPTLNDLLTLKQVVTGDEPGTLTFELPLKYEAVTNLGELRLLVDHRTNDNAFDDMVQYGDQQSCERATNGDCLIIWQALYDPSGQHVVRAIFSQTQALSMDPGNPPIEVAGPLLPCYTSNLFQLSEEYSHYEADGMTLYAKLAESNGLYKIEIQSMSGEHFRTFSGRTTNGIVKITWDLKDEHGRKYTNGPFNVTYDITLPDSGRTQKIR